MQSSKEQQGEIKKVFLTDQCKETEKNNPCSSAGKEFAYNAEDLGSIPKLGRSPGEGKDYLLQYSGLENSMDYTAHGVTKGGSHTWGHMTEQLSLVFWN